MKPPNPVYLTEKEELGNLEILETLVELEIQTMLRKGAIQMVPFRWCRILKISFQVQYFCYTKKTSDKFKKRNQNIPYVHFKMEGLNSFSRKGIFYAK